MKKYTVISYLALLLLSGSCKKEETVPAYPVGKGKITGTTSNGISFTVEGANTFLYVTRTSLSGWGDKDDLIIYAAIDLSIGRHFSIWMGGYENKSGIYNLNINAGEDRDDMTFTQEFNPIQVEYRLFNPSGGTNPQVHITRKTGNYIEGTYFARLRNPVNGNPEEISIEGSFQGNLEIRE